jgi:hypothetical protein
MTASGVSSQKLGVNGVLAGGVAARQHAAARIIEKLTNGFTASVEKE